ncbi:MAG: CPBP family intramembrane metalloprotease [Lachnoclostridium sp.]|nr:CPBP family intramembrane metalloprotease [Lachnoclostridium sp.]
MEKKRDWINVLSCLLGGFVLLCFSGIISQPLEKIMPPYGYLFRFLVYAALTIASVKYLTKQAGITLEQCRITKVRLHPLGILFAICLPVVMVLWTIHGEPGHFVYNQMSTEQAMEILFYLMFHTGFCSGIVEEMMFRGALTRICEEKVGRRLAWIMPTFLFVLPHLRNISSPLDFWSTCLFMTAISIFFTVLTYRTGTVWDAALVHAFWDMFAARSNVVAVSSEMESGAFFTYVLDCPELHPLQNVRGNESLWMVSAVFLVCSGLLAVSNLRKKR